MNYITNQPTNFKDISLIMVFFLPLPPRSPDGLCRRWFTRSHDHLKVITIVLRYVVTTQPIITQAGRTHDDTK